jgi:hypothetical protein
MPGAGQELPGERGLPDPGRPGQQHEPAVSGRCLVKLSGKEIQFVCPADKGFSQSPAPFQ